MTGEFREALERTGHLYTSDPNDVGHIPAFWRDKVIELCDLLDSAPLGIAGELRAEREAHDHTRSLLRSADAEITELKRWLARKDEEMAQKADRFGAGVRLVEEATPRMRTLNNAMSPDWLRRADEFLKG